MSNHKQTEQDDELETNEYDDHSKTSPQETLSKGYRFEFNADGTLKAVYESEYGVLKPEHLSSNENYTLQADGSVIKTEIESSGTEITTYTDTNLDGLFAKASHTWTPNASSAPTTPGTIDSSLEKDHQESHNDWYEYSESFSEYHIEHSADDKVTVINAQTMQTLDTAVAAQRLLFADQAVAFDDDGNAGQAYRLYKAAFDREADHDGLGYWIAQLDNGTLDLRGAAHAFMESQEFQSLYGTNVSQDQFLNLLYTNVLNRTADDSGKAYWADMLNQDVTHEEVFLNFSESQENKDQVVELIGTGIIYTPYQ